MVVVGGGGGGGGGGGEGSFNDRIRDVFLCSILFKITYVYMLLTLFSAPDVL